jgi:hypothetical protein
MDLQPLILPKEITYEWSPVFIRTAARRFIFRYATSSFVVIFMLLVAGISGLWAGDGGGIAWCLIWLSIIYAFVWLRYYFGVTKNYERMPDRHITVMVAADSITMKTSEHLSTMKWSLIKKVWSFPDVLLIFTYGRWNYIAIPVEPLGQELKKYVEDKVRECGGKVV